ncbi:hypothetical protein [uncultured Hoeflea sp.]|uniref:hypothetical protein n=1 Tax=uncultured Hoeflea sp. TaxID=538666 RepID=UPI0030ED536E
MSCTRMAFAALFGGFVASSAALAGDTVRIDQNNDFNVSVHVNIDRHDTTSYQVNQNGLFNSFGSVSVGSGGVTNLKQVGRQNNALVGQFGSNQVSIIDQIQNGPGFSGRSGRMSRR